MNLKIRIGQSLGRSHASRQGSSGEIDSRKAGIGQRGFTLFEMLLVISIIGIVSAIAVPQFSKWRDKQAVNSASKTLLSHMKQARVIAMAENRSVRISFAANSYTYDDDEGGICGLCKPQTVPYSTFSNKLSIAPTTMRTFSSRGTVNSGSMTLTAGDSCLVLVLNIIGRAYQQ